MKTLIVAIVLLIAMSPSSFAHGTWGHGEPIPEWVTKACCGPADAHQLKPDQVHRVKNGYLIDGYPNKIFDAQALPSEDGEYWAFYSQYRDSAGVTAFSSVYCFFVPSAG